MRFFALLATVASLAGYAFAGHIHSNAHRHELSKRMAGHLAKRAPHTGSRLTYYNTNDGYGACGDQVHDYQFIVALNVAEFGGGYPGPNCNRFITIQYNGKQIQAQIKDACPGCPWGGLDLTPTAFWALTSVDTPILSATWWYNDEAPDPVTTKDPTPTTTWKPQPTTTSQPPPPPPPSTTSTPKPTPTTTYTPPPPPSTTSTPEPSPTPSSTSTSTSTSSTQTSSSSHSSSIASSTSASSSADVSKSSADPASPTSSAPATVTAVANAGNNGVLGSLYQAVLGMGGLAAAGGQTA